MAAPQKHMITPAPILQGRSGRCCLERLAYHGPPGGTSRLLKLGLVWPSDRNLRMVSMIRTVGRLAAVAAVSVVTLAVAPATAPANTPSASLQFVNKAQLQT